MLEFRLADWCRPDGRGRLKLRWETFGLQRDRLGSLFQTRGDALLDLGGLSHVGHDGLIWLLASIRWRSIQDLGTSAIILPTDVEQLVVLARTGFLNWLFDNRVPLEN